MTMRDREITACFLEETDAQHAMDELCELFQVEGPVAPETDDEPHWTLNVLLPDIPAPATVHAAEPMLATVEEVVERRGGSIREEVELSPSVLAELRRRLDTPRSEWVVVTAAERDRRSRENARRQDPRRTQP
jgi:hypothetical protein